VDERFLNNVQRVLPRSDQAVRNSVRRLAVPAKELVERPGITLPKTRHEGRVALGFPPIRILGRSASSSGSNH
jgi:hypothetical protein